jgi:hypothetical protein
MGPHLSGPGAGFGMAIEMEQIPTPMIDGDKLINLTVTKIAAGSSQAVRITSASGELFWWGKSVNLEPVRVAGVLHKKIIAVAC